MAQKESRITVSANLRRLKKGRFLPFLIPVSRFRRYGVKKTRIEIWLYVERIETHTEI